MKLKIALACLLCFCARADVTIQGTVVATGTVIAGPSQSQQGGPTKKMLYEDGTAMLYEDGSAMLYEN